jgi:hypothetical protein
MISKISLYSLMYEIEKFLLRWFSIFEEFAVSLDISLRLI